MSKNKTPETTVSVEDFINAVKDETKRNDCFRIIEIMKEITGLEPEMLGFGIIGFGSYHYKYESGREGDGPLVSFSPRATSISLYFYGLMENREELLQRFGKHKADKMCIHIKKLEDINIVVLKEMIDKHVTYIKETYPDK